MAKELKDSSIFIDELYPTVEKNLKTRSAELQRYIHAYIDRNNEVLFAQGPSKRLFFSDKDRDIVYKCIGVSDQTITKAIKQSEAIDPSWKILNNPFNLACILAIRYYQLAKKEKEKEAMILYLSFSFYSSIQYKYFEFEPNENIMAYTINNLSNKFKIKQLGTIFKIIQSTATTNHDTYKKDIEKGTDILIKNYIMSLRTRLDGLIQKIANEFYKTKKSGKYLNPEEDSYDKDSYFIADNVSFIITRTADSATLRMINKGIDQKFITLSANINGVSVNALRIAAQEILAEKDNEIKQLFVLILQLYLIDGQNQPQSIGSQAFLNFCLEIYIKSNTNDKTIIRIKELLDEWLTECSPNYVKTERVATKNNFRKGIYMYFILVLGQAYLSTNV